MLRTRRGLANRHVLCVLAGPLLLLLLAGCRPGSTRLLTGVGVAPPPASPSLASAPTAVREDVVYVLSEPASVSAYLEGSSGQRWTLYEAADRPLAGPYRLSLDGTVPGPGPNERRVLPDGDYSVRLEAMGRSGQREQSTAPVSIRGADTEVPRVEELSVIPSAISPNGDGRDDVVIITYRVSKPGAVTTYADRVLPEGGRQRAWTGEQRSVTTGDQQIRWDGTIGGRPLTSGNYEIAVRADAAGNVVEQRVPFRIDAAGVPEGKIVFARIAPRQVIRGGETCLDAVVRNTGTTVLPTLGPEPGYVYSSLDTYASIEDHRYVERPGVWRVGLDASAFATTTGARYPWRWGLGRDLPPGEEAAIRGCIRLESQQPRLVLFAALIQENVAIFDAGAGLAEVRISQ